MITSKSVSYTHLVYFSGFHIYLYPDGSSCAEKKHNMEAYSAYDPVHRRSDMQQKAIGTAEQRILKKQPQDAYFICILRPLLSNSFNTKAINTENYEFPDGR